MKIIQITDLHLPSQNDVAPPEYTQAWADWEQMQAAITLNEADLIVNTGDICRATPAKEIYERYYASLDSLDIPIINLSGNHDNLDFIQSHEHLQIQQKKEGMDILFLHCTPAAQLTSEHHDILLKAANTGPKPLVVFMHYPPLYAGSPYMDSQYAFAGIDTVLPVLENSARPITVFCGHYHMARTIKSGSLTAHITPSPYMNIDPAHAERVDCKRYTRPYREIVLLNGQISTSLAEATL
jgi:Icc protein